MIQQVIKQFDQNRDKLKLRLSNENNISSYRDLVNILLSVISDEDNLDFDYEELTSIDHGHYQGTEIFIFPVKEYQPRDYYYFCVDYGSCSGCDTLQHVLYDYCDNETQKKIDGLFTLCLHMAQSIRKLELN